MNRYLSGIVPLAALSVLLIAALFMMSAATQNSEMFGQIYSVLLLVNILGIGLLLLLIGLNLVHLARQYRARVLGSRLTLRLLMMFTLLAVLPVSVVFFFSVQTLNRGIDSWFDVKIEQALDDALLLGRTSLDAIKQDLIKDTHDMAAELESTSHRTALPILNYLRETHGVTELTLYTQDGQIIAASSEASPETRTLLPDHPTDEILARIRQGQTHANLDATTRSGLRVRVVAPVYARDVGAPLRILQVMQGLPIRYAKLGENVQTAYAEYEKLVYLRGPLKFSFTLTLSLVTLLTLLIAFWSAIFSARRLVAPLGDLAAGTRAVADGDYSQRLPVKSNDELGILVKSFNDMTRRIQRAQSHIKRSSRQAEAQRAYLETVLNHLSSGVLSFDPQHILRTHNTAASQILDVELQTGLGQPLAWIGQTFTHLQPLTDAVEHAVQNGQPEWQAEVVLRSDRLGPRTLILRGTLLPELKGRHDGYVVVFDDVTMLIQAQRAAAWGDVARRMAHEIKNPLTPIQLSAERIRHKYLSTLDPTERNTLDRATRTIVEQVESLKALVNAFSDYARPAQIEPKPVAFNDLVHDVIELYRAERGTAKVVRLRAAEGHRGAKPVVVKLELAKDLLPISADPGRLRQVLHNLLINARDALAETREPMIRITTSTVLEGGLQFVELSMIDNGPGFPDALLERLFEPYITSKTKGTGLGLAIVKRIIEEHGGSIKAENRTEGGAHMILHLPVALQPSTQASEILDNLSFTHRRAHGDQNT